MASFRNSVQCVNGTLSRAAKKICRDCSQTDDEENGGHFGTEAAAVPQVKRAGGVEREVPTKEATEVLYKVFGKAALPLVNTKAKEKVENINPLISSFTSNAGELRGHVNRIEDCKRLLDDRSDEELAEECYTKEIVNSEKASSVPGAGLYKKDVVRGLRRQMAMGSLQYVFFSLQNLLQDTGQFVGTLHGQKTKRKMQKIVMALRNSDA